MVVKGDLGWEGWFRLISWWFQSFRWALGGRSWVEGGWIVEEVLVRFGGGRSGGDAGGRLWSGDSGVLMVGVLVS